MKLIGKGAEADLFFDDGFVKKIRVSKGYRLKELDDDLRHKRTRSESKILKKIGDIGPGFISCDVDEIRMNFIQGSLVKNVLDTNLDLANNIGILIARLHDLDVVHGDLTTSNMILSSNGLKIIDFGLSFISDKVEDKAVDIHLFKEAITSKHFAFEDIIWKNFIKGYNPKNKEDVLSRLSVVESRGRNKLKY
jgi:N6-L-threonylcarbamoyladenine synthase/protein kinase Bud32